MRQTKKQTIMRTALSLFAKKGFYTTTIADIAKEMGMSVGNMYNYFSSKEELAKELLVCTSREFAKEIQKINQKEISSEEKIKQIIKLYFDKAINEPEVIDYFMRVYLSNKEIFNNKCEGIFCVSDFVTELMIFFESGVRKGELKNQDFFSAFGLFMGYIGGLVFLNGNNVLPKPLNEYTAEISQNIYNALKK